MPVTGRPLDDLVVYCVREILRAGEECTFERLVYECFTRFPAEFGLRRYPQWPDSARVNKSWLRCRTDKGWIAGSVKEGFRLTPAGEIVAERVARQLAGKPARTAASPARARDRSEAIVKVIRADPLFVRFRANTSEFQASEMEVRRALGATLETPVRILRQNINAYRNAAMELDDSEVLDFLSICDKIVVHKSR